MSTLIRSAGLVSRVLTWIHNLKTERTIRKLSEQLNRDVKVVKSVASELVYTCGTIESDGHAEKRFEELMTKIPTLSSSRFTLCFSGKASLNEYLILTQCNDSTVDVVSEYSNSLSIYLRVMIFKLQVSADKNSIEVKSHLYYNLEEKNLMQDFYQLLKSL